MDTYKWIRRFVAELAEERGIDLPRSFSAWCLHYVHGIDRDEALSHSDTAAGAPGGDGGVDGWWRDEENREFHLWQCKWSTDGAKSYSRTAGTELLDGLEALLEPTAAASRGGRFAALGARLRGSLEADYDVVLNLGLAGSLTTSAQTQLVAAVGRTASQLGCSVRLAVWDLGAFQLEAEDRHPTNEDLSGVSVQVRLQSPAVLHIDDGDPTLPAPWEAVVASLNAASLGDVAAEYGPRLFSLNVRYALGSNRRIKNLHRSLIDAGDNPYFWLYNNGITIVCDDFELRPADEPPVILLTNPQVVNGCQTITAFKRRRGEYSDAPSILARIIKPPTGEDSKEKGLLIAERTNSQNEVQARDLKTNHHVQRKLAVAFDQLDAPWFYERKRGEWGGLGSSQRRRYQVEKGQNLVGLGFRRIEMEKAGQSYRMLFEPARSITRKREMFDDDDVYSWVFRSNRSPEHYLFAFLLRRRFETLWHHTTIGAMQAIIGRHVKETTVRRMLRAKGQVVAHSMALTRMLLQREEPAPDGGDVTTWTAADSRNGLLFAENFEPVGNQWLRLLWKAFKETLDSADGDDEDRSFKKLLERGERAALEELWMSTSEAAAFLLGPEWRQEMRAEILKKVTA